MKLEYYLARPFSLFGASLWHEWYGSDQTKKFFGEFIPYSLYIENPKGIVRNYRDKNQNAKFKEKVRQLSLNTKKCKKYLKKGLLLNKKAEEIIKKKDINFEKAIVFLIDLAHHSTILPYWMDNANKELCALAEKLRTKSLYPEFVNLITNIAKEKFKIDPKLLTLTELRTSNFKDIKARKKAIKEGKQFIYENIDGKESVKFKKNVGDIITKIEKIDATHISGQIAYKGKVKGIVRVVFDNDPSKVKFNKGDILVSISTSPILMPLIDKCSAIVTDEGGVSCHAAVISRELKKPCIIGTKNATLVLKGGDKILVDANKGIVRKIK